MTFGAFDPRARYLTGFDPRARYLTGLGAGSRTTRRRRARRLGLIGQDDETLPGTLDTSSLFELSPSAPASSISVPQGTFLSPTDIQPPSGVFLSPTDIVPGNTAAVQTPSGIVNYTVTQTPSASGVPSGSVSVAQVPATSQISSSLGLSTPLLLLLGGGILLIAMMNQ